MYFAQRTQGKVLPGSSSNPKIKTNKQKNPTHTIKAPVIKALTIKPPLTSSNTVRSYFMTSGSTMGYTVVNLRASYPYYTNTFNGKRVLPFPK